MSDLVATVLAIALAAWTAMAFRIDRRLFLCILPHNGAWVAACVIVGSGLLGYVPLSGYAWVLLVTAIAAYNVGVVLTRGRPVGRPAGSSPGALTSVRVYALLLVGFTVGFAVYLRTVASAYGLSTLLTDPSSIRAYTTDAGYLELFPLYGKVLFYLGPLCFTLTVLPGLVRGLERWPAALRWGAALYLLLGQAAALQRTNVFISVLMAGGVAVVRAGISTEATHRRWTAKQLSGLLALAVASVLTFQGIAVLLGKTGTEDPTLTYAVSPSLRHSSLVGPMHYIASGLPAFSNLVESQDRHWPDPNDTGNAYGDYNPQTWGAATGSAVLKLVPGATSWPEVAPFTEVPAKTNVYTWLEPWYRDFRAPGAVLGSLAIGMVVGACANRAARSPRAAVIGGFVLGLTLLAPFTNHYTSVIAIVLYGTTWLAGNRRAPATPEPARDAPAAGVAHGR